ncbi:uncharacterized protein LOC110418322 [Herrania umbratica]|uniref:Uncharacterized protein LOC110418322 n=1 Tax=Herrania umbratica TaxID=108875 RepID=A0A6J1AIN0_9ROSI|nr:uncharacterized protein LOC110418322 [Herrania umbratica]
MKGHLELPSLVSPLEYTHDDNANMNSSEAVDMDIDMVGEKIVGISDTAVSKESTRDFNEWAVKETLDAITNRKFSTVLEDLDSVIQPISLEFEQECRNDSDLPSKNTEKIKSTSTLKPLEHPLESSLCGLPSSMGETCILPGFEGLLKLNSSNRAPKAPSAEEKNYLNERRIVSQVKEEIGCQGILQIAFGVSSPQRQGSIEDYSSRGSQKQHQVLACHLVNDPSAACPPPCLSGKGTKVGSLIKIEGNDNEKPFEMRAKKGLQSTLFLSKDKSKMVAGSFNGPCAVEVKAEIQVEDDRVNNSHGLHATLPGNMETSQCLRPVASTRVNLSVAGRSRGNTGAASAGGLIRDRSGKWIVGYNLNLGRCSSLSTDLWALFQGIKFTWDRGYRKVLVESDSVAAVECLRKAPSLLDSNIALIKSCRDLLNRKWDCKVHPIQREENLCANWLATHVEGCLPGLSIIKVPPLELNPLLENDCVRVAHTQDSPSAVSFSHCKSH